MPLRPSPSCALKSSCSVPNCLFLPSLRHEGSFTKRRGPWLCLTYSAVLLFLFIRIALWPISPLGAASIAAARVIPPVSSGPFACNEFTHTTRVNHTIPSFRVGGSSCFTVSANRCTYEKGLQIIIPSSMPPPGMNPLVRILIYQSSFRSLNSADPALFIQSTNTATSQQYRLEVVIANSTILAERMTDSVSVCALHFSSINFINSNVTVNGCHIATMGAYAYGLRFSSSHITNSTLRVLSSTVEANGVVASSVSIDSRLTGVQLHISGSLLNASASFSCYGLSFVFSPLLGSTVRLFRTRIVVDHSAAIHAFGLYINSSPLTN